MRVVLDTSVVVSAFRSSLDASHAVLVASAERRFVTVASPVLFLEYEDVLKRPEQRLVSNLSENEIDLFLREFAMIIEPAEVHFKWRPFLPDPADDMVLEAALNGGADTIVTFNARDFALAKSSFGISVLLPQQFLQEIKI